MFPIGLIISVCFVWHYTCGLFIPLEDSLLLNKYSFKYVSKNEWDQNILNNKTLLRENSIVELGSDLQCLLPKSLENDDQVVQEKRNETELKLLLTDNLEKGVKIITKELDDICVVYPNGFWNYEYCPGKEFIQFHGQSKKDNKWVFTLGISASDIKDREFQLLYNEYGYYISEILDGGEICEVTKQPRVTEIQYVCGPANGAANMQWTREIKTCHYEASVSVPALCELELLALSDENKMAKPLICLKDTKDSNQAKSISKKDTRNLLNVISEYNPLFLGYGFYLLNPKISSYSHDQFPSRSVLMYSGISNIEQNVDAIYRELYQRAGKAMTRMMYLKFLTLPDGNPYMHGDRFTWISDVVDLNGKFITRMIFTIDEKDVAEIKLDYTLEFKNFGNFVSYQRAGQEIVFQDDIIKHIDDTHMSHAGSGNEGNSGSIEDKIKEDNIVEQDSMESTDFEKTGNKHSQNERDNQNINNQNKDHKQVQNDEHDKVNDSGIKKDETEDGVSLKNEDQGSTIKFDEKPSIEQESQPIEGKNGIRNVSPSVAKFENSSANTDTKIIPSRSSTTEERSEVPEDKSKDALTETKPDQITISHSKENAIPTRDGTKSSMIKVESISSASSSATTNTVGSSIFTDIENTNSEDQSQHRSADNQKNHVHDEL
ncbi:hypothetical protein Kpol_1052p4 [Vanderwaltozyma polyspora DSM 70294]|uniref:Endoplasmic reticulum lectin n=1 Tax=Vanderwaltozyma polyspora (strain ATCC 22028 / DSM 70294 / BCRC 21397 / CBS 2163 / NBRC 10782 / NRRL Y-8283 / UCD 57-17) TaxID=436907 RepID=A7TM15_VANPO|nr:uncharacterized protein Kpol_1052p4 [Vanderwaltozyma polyspora DSM 70294]EDO16657.1 hypothetical protein Kpol_1052p4 [Vanderwaltozyma polyspora DSM 70294]